MKSYLVPFLYLLGAVIVAFGVSAAMRPPPPDTRLAAMCYRAGFSVGFATVEHVTIPPGVVERIKKDCGVAR